MQERNRTRMKKRSRSSAVIHTYFLCISHRPSSSFSTKKLREWVAWGKTTGNIRSLSPAPACIKALSLY